MHSPTAKRFSTRDAVILFIGALAGFTFSSVSHEKISVTQPSVTKRSTVKIEQIHPATGESYTCFSKAHGGIWPLMRDFQCGHENMQTPRILRLTANGNGRFVVDVGLDEGDETLDAVANGFVVFGFEMITASIESILSNAEKRNLGDRIHIVDFETGPSGKVVPSSLPKPPNDGKGFAYIFNAALSDDAGALSDDIGKSAAGSAAGHVLDQKWSPGMVPVMALEDALPSWVERIFFVKIDTQGFDLKVLKGAETYLRSHMVQYAQYEFSPMLMRKSNLGDPLELLHFLTSMGAICFDMMGTHHELYRPSISLTDYLKSLESGKNSKYNHGNYRKDPFGPWDDILCWFPDATE